MRADFPQEWWWSTRRDPPCHICCCLLLGIGTSQKALSRPARHTAGSRTPAKPNGASADFERLAADKDLRLAAHVEKQCGGAAHEFSLRDLQLNRQRALHRETPRAEICRRRAGGGILENCAA